MWEYDPKDAEYPVLDPGEYTAVLDSAEEKVSKKGNPMLECQWRIIIGSREVVVTDYIVNPATLFRLKAMAEAFGQLNAFEAGTFDPFQFVGKAVQVTLEIEKQDGYAPKNRIRKFTAIKDYVQYDAPPNPDSEDIPF